METVPQNSFCKIIMQNADYHAEKVLCICYPEGIFVSGLRMHKQLGQTRDHLGGQHGGTM